ncbi:MAG TPA: M56 family metallopeptidase [Pseudonocardiaceae bacterium]|jgi:beta-lactamase regulating signal transducer with metallopeptidase domain
MDFGSYLPLLLPLLAVPLVLLAARRLHPAAATWLTAVSSVVLTLGAALSLALFTLAGLAGLSIVVDIGHLSPSVLRRADITDRPVDVIAALLLLALCGTAVVATIRRVRALRTARELAGAGAELVVLAQDQPVAHAVPGQPGRIVVSTGMLTRLTPPERSALFAHERAHLDRSHHLFVAVVDVFAAANPLLRPLRGTVRYTTERWADELAARGVGSRSVVATAVGKAALATKDAARDPVLLAASGGEVPRRVAALLVTPPARRLWQVLTAPTTVIALIALVLTATSAGCAIEAAGDLQRVFMLAH